MADDFDIKKISGKTKAAIIMVALGADHAAKIYKNLKEEEVESLTLEIATLPNLDPEKMEAVLNEFYQMCHAQKLISEGGLDFAKEILEKTFGMQKARDIIDKVYVNIGSKAFDFMKKTDAKQLFNFIQNEHPQLIALVLCHATRAQAAEVVGLLPDHKKLAVIERIAKMDRTSPEVIKEVENILQRKLQTIGAIDVGDIGGVKPAAELLNTVDRGTEKYIFDELGKKDENLANEIRKLMFVFEDIVMLDNDAMQKLVRKIDLRELIPALKTAKDEVKDAFFRNMSQKNANLLREDIEYAKNIRARDVEAAQQKIVSKIREMEESGEIQVSHGKDDLIA